MKERDIPVAKLSIISLSKLRTKDSAELALLDEAASNTGFFYLDLRGDSQGERLLGNLPAIQILVENYFGQPEEAKAKDARFDIKAWQDLGWKKRYGGESFEVRIPMLIHRDKFSLLIPKIRSRGTKSHYRPIAFHISRSFSGMSGRRSLISARTVTMLA